ncbi:Metallo-dependent phosphatase [Aulographum hederae CBS 113979]|uniref:Metallo-dependent phosphatase n=1 Tax=Aulographum hederae CBS 113979 TaxID=1176131 RepID=A0A6G1H484_9PEZI|nr:Metallo-dependent phosphatase [Aulographum hederae CBS 113979]
MTRLPRANPREHSPHASDMDGTLKLSLFTDLHFGEDPFSFGPQQDINSLRLIRHVLSTESPDFVILNGDLITGENTYAANSSKYVDRIVAPLVEGGVKWGSTYGNHDSKVNLSREGMLGREMEYGGLSFTRRGPEGTDGVTNYMVPVYGPSSSSSSSSFVDTTATHLEEEKEEAEGEDEEKPIALLYFLDSRGGAAYNPPTPSTPDPEDNIPNWVSPRTASWLSSLAATNKRKWGIVPSLAFVHIPVYAFSEFQRQTLPLVRSDAKGNGNLKGKDTTKFPGLNDDIPLSPQGIGAVGDNTYAGQDIPFMNALLSIEGLHSVHSGHDHGDSWCGIWPDSVPQSPNNDAAATPKKGLGEGFAGNGRPFLCFGKHSGFGGYGNWNRGVRQLLLKFPLDFDKTNATTGFEVESWVRMQWGDDHPQIVTRVGLNATYGIDEYPREDGGYRP